jgi:hypothetical protein
MNCPPRSGMIRAQRNLPPLTVLDGSNDTTREHTRHRFLPFRRRLRLRFPRRR